MEGNIFVTSVSYVLINREQFNKNLKPSLKADKSLHKWLRKWIRNNFLEMEVIEGVTINRFIFDENFNYLRQRLEQFVNIEKEEEVDEEEIEIRKKLDFGWAAIILSEIDFHLDYNNLDHYSSFNPNELRELFSNPDRDLKVRNEVRFYRQ
nr:hypothetical protein pmam_511 [Pithovirus mammoth]